MAKKHGAIVVGDAVSFAPHWFPAVDATGLDFFLFSTYKTFATHVGVMWGSDEALAKTKCQGHYFNEDKPHYRLNPAGPQHGEIAALSGMAEYFDILYAHHFDAVEASMHRRALAVFERVLAIHPHAPDVAARMEMLQTQLEGRDI